MKLVCAHHLTPVELSCYQFQCLHDHESSYDSIGGGNGGYDASCHGWRRGDNVGGKGEEKQINSGGA